MGLEVCRSRVTLPVDAENYAPYNPSMRNWRKILFALAILLVLAIPAMADDLAGMAGEDNLGDIYAMDGEERVKLDDAQILTLANSLLKDGKVDEAEPLFNKLLRSRDRDVRIESAFNLGMIAQVRQDYRRAIRYFLRILGHYPDLMRVRLELARAYFMVGNFAEATFHFQFVIGDRNIDPSVRETVAEFLNLSRRQRNWSAHFSFGIAPDSNMNAASGRTEQCIMTLFGDLCADTPGRKSGIGFRTTMGASNYTRITKNWGVRTTGLYSGTFYENRIFEDQFGMFAVGPRFIFDGGEISMQPLINRRMLSGKPWSMGTGVRTELAIDAMAPWFVSVASNSVKNKFDDPMFEFAYAGWSHDLTITPRYMLSNRSFVSMDFGFGRDELHSRVFSNKSGTIGAGYFQEFDWGFGIGLNYALTYVMFDEAELYYPQAPEDIKDGEYCFIGITLACERLRREHIQLATVSLNSNTINFYGIFPSLRYIWSNRDSNIPHYNFERHRVELLGTYRF